MIFKHYPSRPQKLTKEFIDQEYEYLAARVGRAESSNDPKAWLDLFAKWNALKSYIGAEGSRVGYERAKHMDDPKWEKADKYFREAIAPAADLGGSKILDAILRSRHQPAIAEKYGKHLLNILKVTVEPIAPINNDLRVEVSNLSDQYDRIVSVGEVTINNETVTLPVARALQSSDNAEIRKEAFLKSRTWFLDHREEIATIYDNMVLLRDKMAKNLGHENFIQLGYEGMGRTDYGPWQAGVFRESIRRYVVPLQTRIFEEHTRDLGTPTLKPWDMSYHPGMTLPRGIAPVSEQLQKAEEVFEALSPRLAKHFRRMRKEDLIDLENRKAKRPGAFCTSFSDEGRVAILCNSTGDQEDVSTLMHEMGHAFQAWESQEIEAVELQWPTSDAAEIHSTGMEYLSMPHITKFFDETNAAKYRKNRWRETIELLCYIAVVDEFQHWVYEHPNCGIDVRDENWDRIWDIYKPGIDFSGIEKMKAARWYAQGHLFHAPFYYIDYAIAETGSMQLALLDRQDHDRALESYIKLCQLGGKESVLKIFESAKLRSPFDPTLMPELMMEAARIIEVDYAPA